MAQTKSQAAVHKAHQQVTTAAKAAAKTWIAKWPDSPSLEQVRAGQNAAFVEWLAKNPKQYQQLISVISVPDAFRSAFWDEVANRP